VKSPKTKIFVIASAVAPLVLLGGLVYWFFHGGSALIEQQVPPVEEVSFRRIEFLDGEIVATVQNTGPLSVDLTVITVDEAIWKAEFFPDRHLERLEKATIRMPYHWVEGDPYVITVFTANGLGFETEIDVAMLTPKPNARLLMVFTGMGIYVGVLPVFLGILWLPFVRQLSTRWVTFLLSLTLGLLVFLGVDALHEAREIADDLPDVFEGVAVVAMGFLISFLVITAVDRAARARVTSKGGDAALVLAYLIAVGIGVHNLGEGLAIGSAYAVGEIGLGALLLIGFTIHNTTEGLAIVAPLARSRVKLSHLAVLGLIGGAPTIAGCWIGGFTYSDLWAVFFLAIGAGAIFQVVWTIGKGMMKNGDESLFDFRNAIGFLTGMAIMYMTALLVAA
jgi:ZIP family zinc transporter